MTLRVLIITNLFPNACDPLWAPFNKQQFAALGRLCQVEVLATIPWFPGARAVARWSAAGRLTRVPRRDVIAGLPVRHPRTLLVPIIGHAISWQLYAASLVPLALGYRGRIDVVLGSWAYPDGCAAIALARLIGAPSVVKLHGSDLNVVAALRGPRFAMRRVLPRADRVVAVSRALADGAAALGVPRERIDVVPNGVDGELFRPRSRAEARAQLGQDGENLRVFVYVGLLKEQKGVLDLIRAFAQLAPADPSLALVLVGDGPARAACEAAILAAGLTDRVTLAGARPLEEIPLWMAAADVVVLPSWNEGTPNVLIEALACGRRVVATAVGGIPDLIDSSVLGELVPPREPAALAAALGRAARAPYDPAAVVSATRPHDWAQSALRLHDVLVRATAGDHG